MHEEYPIVLPDSLVAQLVEEASALSSTLAHDFTKITEKRSDLRTLLTAQKKIIIPDIAQAKMPEIYTIDGAHILEIDRATAYSLSCVVRLGSSESANQYMTVLSLLPHVPSAQSLSSGLMAMQEIMLSVKTAEQQPMSLTCIDGSKISSLIAINQFYSGIHQDLPGQLDFWRNKAKTDPNSEPGRTLRQFEERDWVTSYLTNPRIIGNLKLVTSTQLIDAYAPEWSGRYDDKTIAALVLEPGEVITPHGLPHPPNPYHISNQYPYSGPVHAVEPHLYTDRNPSQILHFYYRPDSPHGVYKIEITRKFLDSKDDLKGLLRWWAYELPTPDIHEPYQYHITDMMAKQAVSKANEALREIARKDSGPSHWAWFFTEPYRTPKRTGPAKK